MYKMHISLQNYVMGYLMKFWPLSQNQQEYI